MQEEFGLHPAAVAATSDVARAGRDEADLLTIADPAAARRRFAALVSGEPFPGRLEILNRAFDRAYAAFTRRDWELNTLSMHPTGYSFESGGGDRGLLDLPDRLEGADDYIRGMEAFAEGWGELTLRSEAAADAGPGRVLNLCRFYMRGSGSGITLEQPAAVLFTMDGGWLVRQQYWWDVGAGARAAGVDPAVFDSRD